MKSDNSFCLRQDTAGNSKKNFKLSLDSFDEGIPVPWLISNKESADILWVFITSIRERCRDPKAEIFMSDDAEAYHNAWMS